MSEDAIVSYVVNKIGDLFTQEFSLFWSVEDDVESLKQELQALATFLNTMDYKKRQDAATKNWLSSVRDVAYEAEDLFDTYSLGKRYAPATRILYSRNLQRDIKQLKSKMREIVERRTIYVPNLHEQRSEGSSSGSSSSGAAADQSHLHPWRRSFPHLGDDVVVGLDHDVSLLVGRLLHPERRRQVVAITGMGGAGKTTLAAMVYKSISRVPIRGRACIIRPKEMDPGGELRNHFDVCAWVPVHQDPNIMVLLWTISSQLGFGASAFDNIDLNRFEESCNNLMKRLYEFLEHKRYLIVLDDIWRKEVWDQLKPALPDSGNGSTIIVTTRFRDVAIYHDPDSKPYEMRPLNEDDSWRLFLTKVFPQLSPENRPTCPSGLEDLGRQLCRKCAGLPLALLVLGGLVSTKMRDPLVWSKLLDNLKWDSTDDGKRCLEILALSYYDLSYCMKFCFLYLGAFRQNSDINASKLTKMWIGDDLIPKEEGITLEDTATNYLEELAQRCLVEIVKRGADTSIKKVRVHDLLGELAKSEARESRFLRVKNITTIEEESRTQEIGARRMALHQSHDIIKEISDEKLRALLVFPTSRITGTCSEPKKKDKYSGEWSLHNFLRYYRNRMSVGNISQTDNRMKFLRVFGVDGFTKSSIPKFHTENMTRLRYMRLRNTNIKMLPLSGEIPPHLQTLDIRGTIITELPPQVWTLTELRHLYLNSWALLNSQALRNIEKARSKAASAKSIMPLHNLQTLKVNDECEPPSINDNQLVGFLKFLSSLNSLTIKSNILQEIFTATSTQAKLHKLKLKGALYCNELCDIHSFAPHITKLTLSRSYLEEELIQTLGQLKKLRILKLTDDALRYQEISCSPGSFPNLSYLKLSNLDGLASLNMELGSFPNLMHLSIHSCINLHAVPNSLNHITTLQVLKCKKMPSSFVEEIDNWLWTHPVRVIIQTTSSQEMVDELYFDAEAGPSESRA